MNGKKAKWIRSLFKETDIGMILSMGKVYGKDFVKEVNPRRLYRRAKKLYKNGDPSVKTWGVKLDMKFEDVKTKTKGVENG